MFKMNQLVEATNSEWGLDGIGAVVDIDADEDGRMYKVSVDRHGEWFAENDLKVI